MCRLDLHLDSVADDVHEPVFWPFAWYVSPLRSSDTTNTINTDGGPVYGEVMRQLSEITTNYSNATGVGLVLAATQSEDLNWLLNYCRD